MLVGIAIILIATNVIVDPVLSGFIIAFAILHIVVTIIKGLPVRVTVHRYTRGEDDERKDN